MSDAGHYEACVWDGAPGRIEPGLSAWLEALGQEKRRELGRLLHQRGGLLESRILDDWIAEHGGQRRWRYVMYGKWVDEGQA